MEPRNVAAMIHRHDNVTNTTRAVERYHPPTCHPDRNEMEWRDLLKLQVFPYAGYYCNLSGFLHSADATVGMTYVFYWLLQIKMYTEWPYGQWRQIAAATPVSFNSIRNVAAMIHRHETSRM